MEKENIEKYVEANKKHKKEKLLSKPIIVLMVVAASLMLINYLQIDSISWMLSSGYSIRSASSRTPLLSGNKDLVDINLEELKSTAHTIQAVFQLEGLNGDEVMGVMFPTGTPDYGEELGVNYDDPVTSLGTLAKMYPGLKAEVEKNNPEGFQRFMDLALKPVGISCEYCCGLQTIGIKKNGDSACGCQHNPALLTVALYLSAYTDYSDGEILQEVMKWKTLFFPKNMIELGASLAGGDTSALDNLPGMVGGC